MKDQQERVGRWDVGRKPIWVPISLSHSSEEAVMTTSSTIPRTATPLEVASALYDALRKKDVDAVSHIDADDAVGDVVAIGEFRGKRAIRQFLDEMFQAFPDLALQVDSIVGDDSVAMVQWRATATFSGGRFQGIEPTGQRIEMRGVDVVTVDEGRVVRDTMYYDGVGLARQIGMLPRHGSGADKIIRSLFNATTRLRQRLPASRRAKRQVRRHLVAGSH